LDRSEIGTLSGLFCRVADRILEMESVDSAILLQQIEGKFICEINAKVT